MFTGLSELATQGYSQSRVDDEIGFVTVKRLRPSCSITFARRWPSFVVDVIWFLETQLRATTTPLLFYRGGRVLALVTRVKSFFFKKK